MERKSYELYAQTAIWCGGIAAAALGGVLLVVLEQESSIGSILLRLLGVALLSVVLGAAYCQFHAIRVLNEKECLDELKALNAAPAPAVPVAPAASGVVGAQPPPTTTQPAAEKTDLEKSRESLSFWQQWMFFSFIAASVCFVLAMLAYWKSKDDPQWVVAEVDGGSSDALIVMSKAGTSNLRILTRAAGGSEWKIENVVVDDPKKDADKKDLKDCKVPVDLPPPVDTPSAVDPPAPTDQPPPEDQPAVQPDEQAKEKPVKAPDFDPSTK